MNILFTGVVDWANLCHRIARGINATGRARARVWIAEPHPFGYQEDWIGQECEEASTYAETCDWVVTTGDGYAMTYAVAQEIQRRSSAKVAVTHAGSEFRRNYLELLDMDKAIGARARFVGMDSLHLAGIGQVFDKTPTYPYWSTCEPVEIGAELAPVSGPIVVAHSPSVRSKKGTELILRALEQAQREFGIEIELIEGVSFKDAIARRARAHIFVDQLNPEVGGFGCSAVEAMAQGCAVIADIRNVPRSNHSPPIKHAATVEDVFGIVREWVMEPRLLEARRALCWAWAAEHARPEAVGNRWLNILGRVG